MTGWIKLEKDLLTDPRVLRMARILASRIDVTDVTHVTRDHNACVTFVTGALARLWMLADSHVDDTDVLPFGVDDIDEFVGIRGFCELLPEDWLQILDTDHVKLPSFHTHNGTSAKERALGAARQQRYRNAAALRKRYGNGGDTVTRPLPDQTRPESGKSAAAPALGAGGARKIKPDPECKHGLEPSKCFYCREEAKASNKTEVFQ